MINLIILLAFVFGASIGSFLNVLIWRLPRDESIGGRSHCPNCNHTLVWYNLIPLFSYLAQKQKCKYCHHKISPRYFIIELITGILFAFTAWFVTPLDLITALTALKLATIIVVCVVVFVVDYEHYLILDRVIFPAIFLILAFNLLLDFNTGTWFGVSRSLNGIIAGILGFIPFWLLWKFSKGLWMGLGDAKFALFMGMALGIPGIVIGLFMSFTVGAIVGLCLIGLGFKKLSSRLPFGTFLSIATIIAAFYSNRLWEFYWSLFRY